VIPDHRDRRDFAPEFPLEWALQDVALAIAAAGGDRLPLLEALSRQWLTATELDQGSLEKAERYLALATGRTASVPEDRRQYFQTLLAVVRLWLAREATGYLTIFCVIRRCAGHVQFGVIGA
jgi:hypothetical protein